jgi:excisionase family DNA binding protein
MKAQASDNDPLAFSIDEAAELLGVHRQTLRGAIDRGEIHAIRLGRRWLVPVESLYSYLEE